MAAQCGSAFIVKMKNDAGTPAFQTAGGFRTHTLRFNSEVVDVTNVSSSGMWREILTGCGVRSASFSGSGLFIDDAASEVFRDAMFDGTLRDCEITVPGLGLFAGQFKISQLEYSGEYNGAVQNSISLESSGALTFTLA